MIVDSSNRRLSLRLKTMVGVTHYVYSWNREIFAEFFFRNAAVSRRRPVTSGPYLLFVVCCRKFSVAFCHWLRV